MVIICTPHECHMHTLVGIACIPHDVACMPRGYHIHTPHGCHMHAYHWLSNSCCYESFVQGFVLIFYQIKSVRTPAVHESTLICAIIVVKIFVENWYCIKILVLDATKIHKYLCLFILSIYIVLLKFTWE